MVRLTPTAEANSLSAGSRTPSLSRPSSISLRTASVISR
jgi:hypothetical protein